MYFKSLKIGDEFFWRSRASSRVGGPMLLLLKVSETHAKEVELWRDTTVGGQLKMSPYAKVESAEQTVTAQQKG